MPPAHGYAGAERPADADLGACTRCGFCEQACPTYRELRSEPDSPRGRVFLMKQVAEGAANVDAHLAEHLYVCLGCRACESACPAGVPFGRLLEYGRYQVELRGGLDPARRGWRLFRAIAFGAVFPNPLLFQLAVLPARILQAFPALAALVVRLAPPRVAELVRMLPRAQPASRQSPRQAPHAIRARVAMLEGCVMGALFSHVNRATLRVLRRNGCDVVNAPGQWCCGALNVHAGERERAKVMARRNIDAFERAGVEAVIVNSAGCGAHMKEYAELLRHDPAYAARARAFAQKVKDVSEFLVDLGPCADFGPVRAKVTYQDACHLAHGQGVREQPRSLLRQIPGLELVELQWADRCCGAAGVYNLTQREMAQRILAEKMDDIAHSGADTVAVGNPGCHMQIQAGIAQRGLQTHVRHVVELLDEAYAAAGA